MASQTLPDGLQRGRHVEESQRPFRGWGHRVVLVVMVAIVVAGLLNVFGQRGSTSTASNSKVTFTLAAPERLRGGLLFQARFAIHAHSAIKHPVLVLAPGWVQQLQINSTTPAPTQEGSREGKMFFQFNPIASGGTLEFYLQGQVNPTNVGNRNQDVDLYDSGQRIAHIHRTLFIYP